MSSLMGQRPHLLQRLVLSAWLAALLLTSIAAPTAHRSRTPAGSWEGVVHAAGAQLHFTLTLAGDTSGWRGTVDVPSQYALDYPLQDVRIDSANVGFAFPDLLPPGAIEGVIQGDRIQGRFTSHAGNDTIRGTFEAKRRSVVAVPYDTREARFHNGNLELAATVFQPRNRGSNPGVVFVHGSGPQTRDSYLRWFADQFARAGFATLIYDKRGAGQSGGDRWPRTAGAFADLADDALAAVRFLGQQPNVDANRIGVWGLSQGAWIGPLVASKAPGLVQFLIMLSGGGVSPAEQELYDDEANLRDLGYGETAIEQALSYLRLADRYVRSGTDEDWQRFAVARDEVRGAPWYRHLDRFPQALPREAPVWQGLRADLDYDPAPVLATVRVPVLLILGEEDRATPARETATRVQRAMENSGNTMLTLRLLPEADHALMVKPSSNPTWLAQRPADHFVAEMLEWARRLR